MTKPALCLFALVLVLEVGGFASSDASVTATLHSLADGACVTSPLTVQASATSPNGISGWVVYANDQNVYQVDNFANSLTTSVSLPPGTYRLFVRAWDNIGRYASTARVNIVVGGGEPGNNSATCASGYLVPPPDAIIFTQEQNNPHDYWRQTSEEAGGKNVTSDLWTAPHQTRPSKTGSSRQLHVGGPEWTSALWYHRLSLTQDQQARITHFLVDWDFYVDPDSHQRLWTLEYDTYQALDGWEYMMGTHCSFGDGYWFGWNQQTNSWVKLDAPCNSSLTPPGQWHHVQWHMERIPGTHNYRYDTLVVDGIVYNIDLTQPAAYSDWGDVIGVQWQVDTNWSGGSVDEWIDNVRVALW